MVWGAIGKGWRSPLVLVKGRLNSDGYISLLEDNEIFTSLPNFYGEKNYFFEQDGAPSHTSKKTLKFIEDKKVQVIKNWPSNSPDLTCIEQVWAILENKIKNISIKSLNQLYECLQITWYSIPQEKLNNLISKTPDTFKLFIKEEGQAIGHKLYTLNNEKTSFENIFTQDNVNQEKNLSPILKIPLNRKEIWNFVK